jgi:hypothetical protein
VQQTDIRLRQQDTVRENRKKDQSTLVQLTRALAELNRMEGLVVKRDAQLLSAKKFRKRMLARSNTSAHELEALKSTIAEHYSQDSRDEGMELEPERLDFEMETEDVNDRHEPEEDDVDCDSDDHSVAVRIAVRQAAARRAPRKPVRSNQATAFVNGGSSQSSMSSSPPVSYPMSAGSTSSTRERAKLNSVDRRDDFLSVPLKKKPKKSRDRRNTEVQARKEWETPEIQALTDGWKQFHKIKIGMWKTVLEENRSAFHLSRDSESLRCKFKQLHNKYPTMKDTLLGEVYDAESRRVGFGKGTTKKKHKFRQ